MALRNPHLDDTALADLWATHAVGQSGTEPAGLAARHLGACADCRAKYEAFAAWLDDVRAVAHAEADEVFGAERLAAQQAQIARRLEALEGPARVIAFPRFARPVASPSSGRPRWIAGAAAAGLIVGLGLGQFLNQPPAAPQAGASVNAVMPQLARGAGEGAVVPAAYASDEIFVYDADSPATQARVPESLQYLNVITPSARDYDSR